MKVVDGRSFNGSFWVFYGAMSDVSYTINVTDTLTACARLMRTRRGSSRASPDADAFRSSARSGPRGRPRAFRADAGGGAGRSAAPLSTTAPCAADATTLCLNSNRFRVQVNWVAVNVGTSGAGQAAPLASDSGSFWFFSAGNLELNLKVVDGRAVNGRFWVFFGALSDVQYTITVTDTETGLQRIYNNPQGRPASVADTSAF